MPVLGTPGLPAPERRLSLTAHDEPVREVLLRLADLAHTSVVVGDDVHGNVSVGLRDASVAEAFDVVCGQARLRCRREGRSIVVSSQSSSVIPLAVASADPTGRTLQGMFPRLTVRANPSANALVLSGSDADVQAARAVVQGLDVRDASRPVTEAIMVKSEPAAAVATRLRALYPKAKIGTLARNTLVVSAASADLAQIKMLVAGVEATTAQPPPQASSNDAVIVSQRNPKDIARALGGQVPRVRAAVSGSTIALTGATEDVARAKTLIGELDVPPFGMRYVQIYRLRNVDASSVAEMIQRSFPSVTVTVDTALNAISVTAAAGDHQRIAAGIAQLDGAGGTTSGSNGEGGGGGSVASGHEVVQLRSIVPGVQGGSSTSATDIAQAVVGALQGSNPDLRVTVPNGMQSLILSGSPQSIRAAKDVIAQLDTIPQSVVLDTEILEMDENSSRNLGLQLGTTSIGTTFSEVPPTPGPNGQASRLIGFQPLTRTGLSFAASLNLLIQKGNARVLADPRITTLSGRTASIRAGDTISIVTTVGGGTGTVATTQLQSFQTGVSLDITPIITSAGELSVALHPVVNSLTGYLNGVPQISTRDTQTSVHLHDNETLVIGGLIQENTQHTQSKIPLLGDIPLVGRAFRDDNTTSTRNELIIVVTPHLLGTGATTTVPSAVVPGIGIPTARPLPTLPPGAAFPNLPPAVASRPVATPGPIGSPRPVATSPGTPQATPAAFGQANTFVYGSPPPNTYAAPGDAPQIFYASFTPSVLTPTATARINVITTTNVQRVTIGTGTTSITLSPVGAGTWQGVFPANTLALSPTGGNSVRLTLTASRSDGQNAAITIPVSVMSPGMAEPVL